MSQVKELGLPQTKGVFQFRGKVTGTAKDNFYKETETKTKKPFRAVNFGLKITDNETNYLSLNGMEKDKVYFSKQVEENGKKKTVVEDVPWKDRLTFNKEGFRLIGINVGITKKVDDKNNKVNDNKVMTEFEACDYIGNNLKDDQSLFVKGAIEYSHFANKNGEVKRATKFIPGQISLCKKDIDFEAEDFEPMADFTQTMIFMGINKVEDRFVVEAKIITYNSVEEAEFYVDDSKLASLFKKNLKPYTLIKVWGSVKNVSDVAEVEDTDAWGTANSMDKVNTPTRRELVITGADPSSIDKDTYSEEIIDTAIAKMNANKNAEKEYGQNENWGNQSASSDDEEW